MLPIRGLRRRRAAEAALEASAVADPRTTVRADVERLLSSPSLSPKVSVSGHVYDIATDTSPPLMTLGTLSGPRPARKFAGVKRPGITSPRARAPAAAPITQICTRRA
jgi:hypothetical protein